MPRFRLFAGPNGSGKSSLYKHLRAKGVIHTEIYVSADRIENDIRTNQQFNFNAYRVKVSEEEFKNHVQSSGLFAKMESKNFIQQLSLKGGVLKFPVAEINSYLASYVATYLASKLFESKQSFCFETVMSHESKIEMLKLANKKGYKTYLYFVFLENYLLNLYRVRERVKVGGHQVDEQKIQERFYRSFKLLKPALQHAANAFVINNSVDFKIEAEQFNGKLNWLFTKSKVLQEIADL